SHFARLPYNAELSSRFLDDYLRNLDYQRIYFTQADVDDFRARYGDRLHTLLIQGNSMNAATEIYRLFEKRVEARVALADRLLERNDFDFTQDESAMLSRKDAAWPKNEEDAAELWRIQIKEAILSEMLRREMLAKMAAE